MRLIFGMMSLLLALLMIGMLVKKQPIKLTVIPASAATFENPTSSFTAPPGLDTPLLQSQQIQQKIQESAEISIQRQKAIDGK